MDTIDKILEEIKQYLSISEVIYLYTSISELVKISVNDKIILTYLSEHISLISTFCSNIINTICKDELELDELCNILSILCVSLKLLRNVSSISKDKRVILGTSQVIKSLLFNINGTPTKLEIEGITKVNKNNDKRAKSLVNKEKTHNFLIFVTYKIMLKKEYIKSELTIDCINDILLLPSVIFQLLANLCIENTDIYHIYIFRNIYPFGLLNICLLEIIWRSYIFENKYECKNITVGSGFHLLYVLNQQNQDFWYKMIENEEVFNCFLYISLSLYNENMQFNSTDKSSEWIILFFRRLFCLKPEIFCKLYHLEIEEHSSDNCDIFLVFLTLLDPYIQLNLENSGQNDISNISLTPELRRLQNILLCLSLSLYDLQILLLAIWEELEANLETVFTNNKADESNMSVCMIKSENVLGVIQQEILLGALQIIQYINKIIDSKDFDLIFENSKSHNFSKWLVLTRSLFRYIPDNHNMKKLFLEQCVLTLNKMLEIRKLILDLRNDENRNKGEQCWINISANVPLESLVHIITITCENCTKNQNLLRKLGGIPLLLQCINITDANHPFLKEAAILSIKVSSSNNALNKKELQLYFV
ncbi:hypothetical protein cand_030300 [Cryptosporidium andersoni]|uniref:Ataxin-10 domain-containing protein n=1 Tax=Cryptosporidium andersoni TaxID=117008 RepID=A0A1J4MNG6_9CRYT|nr:hypothetical protein cand_030300 [Cryptosporidium andersoni]